MRADLRAIAQAVRADPVAAIFERFGDPSNYRVAMNLVLVATYIKPPKILKGPNGEDIEFHYTDKTLAEDRFQGKSGLILKVGPLAFKDRPGQMFGGQAFGPGDWVAYVPSNGTECFLKDQTSDKDEGIPARWIDDFNILGEVADPTLIY